MTSVEFRAEVDRLVRRLVQWTPSKWAASTASGPSRAEQVHALVQRLADLAADAEGQPRRPVPRLENDLALPDQVRVLADDLIAAAGETVPREAGDAVTAARRSL